MATHSLGNVLGVALSLVQRLKIGLDQRLMILRASSLFSLSFLSLSSDIILRYMEGEKMICIWLSFLIVLIGTVTVLYEYRVTLLSRSQRSKKAVNKTMYASCCRTLLSTMPNPKLAHQLVSLSPPRRPSRARCTPLFRVPPPP